MALPKDYAGEYCSLARSLEVIGERWTMLIVRDAFFGVRRFGDFTAHLGIPRAVLAERLSMLVAVDILATVRGTHGHDEYVLTDKGISLWPVLRSLLAWGDAHYSELGPVRVFQHAIDSGSVGIDGVCTQCGLAVSPQDLMVLPGPGLAGAPAADNDVSHALTSPRRLLDPIRG
jgi:DNA-binding HxlR family transcriptional regulator